MFLYHSANTRDAVPHHFVCLKLYLKAQGWSCQKMRLITFHLILQQNLISQKVLPRFTDVVLTQVFHNRLIYTQYTSMSSSLGIQVFNLEH